MLLKAVGCKDLKKPEHTWMERKGDEIKMGCVDTKDGWTLKCRGNHWIGLSKKCKEVIEGIS